jgi:DNA-binding transcriptional LysR family regulator
VTVADLDGEPFILPQRDVNAELFDATLAYFADHSVEPDYRPRHITSPAQLIELVLSGQGLAFGSAGAAPEPGLMQLPLVGQGPPGQTVYLLWRRGPTNPVLRRILRTVRNKLSP